MGCKIGIIDKALFLEERNGSFNDAVKRQAGKILTVHPGQFLHVIDSCFLAHLAEVKDLHRIFEREDFFVIARRPAQKGQIVYDSFWKITLAAEFFNARCSVAFTEFAPIRCKDHGHMTELRGFPAQCLIDKELFRRVGDMFFGAQDMGHAHEMIINDNGKVIGWDTAALHDDKIIVLVHIKLDIAMDHIMEANRSFERHLDADRIGFAIFDTLLGLFWRNVAAGPSIVEGLFQGTLLSRCSAKSSAEQKQ